MATSSKVSLVIDFDDGPDEKVPRSYTTWDNLRGKAIVSASQDTKFETVEISLEGLTRVFNPQVTVPGGSHETAVHIFLKLRMPIDETSYPQDRILQAGKSYTFPFDFSIPPALLSQVCGPRASEPIEDNAHLLLPPSMGHATVSSDGVEFKSDMAPETSKIQYYVKTVVNGRNPKTDDDTIIVEKSRKFRLIPHFTDEPPFDVTNSKDDFVYSKVKKLKKGGVVPFTSGPTYAGVHHDEHLTGTIKVHLRFDPIDPHSKPPKLDSLITKLKVHNFYSTRHLDSYLNRRYPSAMSNTIGPWNRYVAAINLPNRCIMDARKWLRHSPEEDPGFTPLGVTLSRIPTRGSHVSSSEEDSEDSDAEVCQRPSGGRMRMKKGTKSTKSNTPTASRQPSLVADNGAVNPMAMGQDPNPPTDRVYWTCNIPSPFTFPRDKTYLPTFASCHVSRQYSLGVSLIIHTPGAMSQKMQIHLSVPLQVSVAIRPGYEGRSRDMPEMRGMHADPEFQALMGPRGSTFGSGGAQGAGALPPTYSASGYRGRLED